MDIIEVYITTAVAIIALGYPILLQVISQLEQKYSSTLISELYDAEPIKIWFKRLSVISMVAIFIWTLKMKPLFQIDGLNIVINNSATLFVAITVSLLVLFFFLFINKTLIYSTPIKFVDYLIARYSKEKDKVRSFNTIADVFLLSVKTENDYISRHLSSFFYDQFRNVRKSSTSKAVEYPEEYYWFVYRTIEELVNLKEKRNKALEYRASGGIWLLGEGDKYKISEHTYTWMWRNLLLALDYDRDEMIINHWENAHQYAGFHLERIMPKVEYINHEATTTNEEAMKERDSERRRFLEFHIALGGLLLYKARYKCIKRMFSFTTSFPPRYELLPSHMNGVFHWYFHFSDPYEIRFSWISHQYWFPELTGLNADGLVKKWIKAYTVLLFLRQYASQTYYVYEKPLEYPQLPDLQSEKQEWLNGIDDFKSNLEEILSNRDLLKSLDLDFITEDWCRQTRKEYPLDYLDNLKKSLIRKYEADAINQQIDQEKVLQFYQSSLNILVPAINDLTSISNKAHNFDDGIEIEIGSETLTQDKDPFSIHPEAHHMNFDTILAKRLRGKLFEGFASTFISNKKYTFLLKHEDVFKAVDRLKDEDIILIGFGFNIQYYRDILHVKELSETNYKNVPIKNYHGNRILNHSLFVLKRSDLPIIELLDIPTEIIKNYSLEEIGGIKNLYGSVLDLNVVNIVREQLLNEEKSNEQELKKSVYTSLVLSLKVTWKKDSNLYQLTEHLDYSTRGLPNSVSDIPLFK